jgi:hypothetical protein
MLMNTAYTFNSESQVLSDISGFEVENQAPSTGYVRKFLQGRDFALGFKQVSLQVSNVRYTNIETTTNIGSAVIFAQGANEQTSSLLFHYPLPETQTVGSDLVVSFLNNRLLTMFAGTGEAATNEVRNNTMVGAVAGITGTVPTFWAVTGDSEGVNREIVGTGTENDINYIDIRYFGTVSPGPFSTKNIFVDGINTNAVASQGETWTGSSFVRLVGGSLSNTTVRLRMNGRTEDSSITNEQSTKSITPTGGSLEAQRFALSHVMQNASVERVTFVLDVICSGTVDITIRIGWPQLEIGPVATRPVPTAP